MGKLGFRRPAIPPQGVTSPVLKYIDEQGHWWVAHFQTAGIHYPKVFEFDGTVWKGYNTEFYPLGDNYLKDIAFDCNGNTWFGGNSTAVLNVSDGINWQEYKPSDIGVSIDTWTMTTDTANCMLWIGSYEGSNGIVSYDGTSFTQHNGGGGAIEVKIGPDGNVWVTTRNNGVGKFDGSAWTWYNESNSPITNTIWDIAFDLDGNVWMGTYGKGLAKFDGTDWQVFNSSNSPLPIAVFWVYADHSGSIWAWNKGQALRYNGADWEVFPVLSGKGDVLSMTEDVYGNLWFATTNGVHFWDGNNFTEYNVTNSPIGEDMVWEVKIDPYGNKWFVHSTGVSVFNEYGISTRIINPPNSIRGQVFFDTDQDGTKAPNGEPGLPSEKIILQPDQTTTYSSIGGLYTFYPTTGNHEISIQPDTPYVPTSPSTLSLLMGNADQTGFDFGVWSNDPPDSVSVDITASMARCNETFTIWIQVPNHGLLPASGSIELTTYPNLLLLESNKPPESNQGNVITWKYEDLAPFGYEPIKVKFKSPGANSVGDLLEFNVVATRTENENITQTTQDYTNTEVRCSYDPNDKKAEATGDYIGNLSLLTDPLDFTIRFQNKGNDTAFIVVIRDTLDANLDPASFEVISFSHPVRTTMTADGVLTFVFENINLLWESFDGPASHGFVKYRIAPREGLPDPTTIENTAQIYFDFNPAIVTNTTENTLVEELPVTFVEDLNQDKPAVILYPNPNTEGFWIEWLDPAFPAESSDINVFDAAGRLHFSTKTKEKKTWIGNTSPGFYVVTLERNGHKTSKKLVVLDK